MATITVDQGKLVLNAFAAIFQNNLTAADLVTWNKVSGEMNDRNALTVVEQVTPDYTTYFTSNGVKDLSGGVQDSAFGSEQYKLSQTINSSMGWGDFVKIRDLGEARESQALRKAALRLASDIDSYILNFAALASNNLLGDGDSAIAEFDDVASAYTRLKEEGVDDDGGLRAVLTYADKQALGSAVVDDNASLASEGGGTYRNGFSGSIAGMKALFTQQLPAHTLGSRLTASALTAGTADSAGAYTDYCVSAAPGQFLSQILNMDIGSGTETIKDGEVFSVAGVYAFDNRANKILDHLQQFRVIGNFTASGGIAAPRVYPAIITSGPYRTVGAAPANTAVVTFVGAASAVLHPRFVANKDAIIVHTADLIMPATGKAMRKALTKVPLSVRMWQDSVFATGEHRVRFDVAIEANVAADARRRLVRINGS